jgi:potassium efflux system protein
VLRRAELDNVKTQRRIQDARTKLLEETMAMVKANVRFSQSDLQGQLVDVGKEETDLKQEVDAAECTLQALDRHWNDVRVKLASTSQKSPALVEEEKSAKLARDCQTRRIAIANKQQGFLGPARESWRRRFALATGNFSRADLRDWKEESRHAAEQVDYERQFAELRIKDCRKILADLDERSKENTEQQTEIERWIAQERSLVDQLGETYGDYLNRLESFDNLFAKLIEEIEAKRASLSLWERLSATSEATSRIWNHELAEFDDHSVTVGKAVWGLGLLAFGVVISRWFTGRFAKRMLGHFGIEGGAAVAFESLAYYLCVVAWALLALRTVHVPLTVFAFMGGAVAIGVGFGSQKILNNFISGVILLVEQPIRVGDVIEIGGLQGTVDRIGTRSTRIRTGANSEIIVPNSAFLENNVINWTLGDTIAGCTVRVVVVRNARAREAARLIERAGQEHGKILKNPAPFVWFADFDEHGLALELHFWIDVHDRRRVESDLRFMMDHYLREAGIELAIAQRDATPTTPVSREPSAATSGVDEMLGESGRRSAA